MERLFGAVKDHDDVQALDSLEVKLSEPVLESDFDIGYEMDEVILCDFELVNASLPVAVCECTAVLDAESDQDSDTEDDSRDPVGSSEIVRLPDWEADWETKFEGLWDNDGL